MAPMTADSGRGLSSELLECIFEYCRPSDLRAICRVSQRLYTITIPILYRKFKPTHWTDIVLLEECLKHGIGPASVDRMAIVESLLNRIRSIDLSNDAWKDIRRCPPDHKTSEYIWRSCPRALIYIIERAKDLRCFTSQKAISHLDLSELWDALGRHQIEELVLPKALDSADKCSNANLRLFSVTTLKKLHLTLSDDEEAQGYRTTLVYERSGFWKLLHSSPRLVDLRIALDTEYGGVDEACFKLRQLDVLSVRNWSKLRYLELVQCYVKGGTILQFLGSLPKLMMFRFLESSPYGSKFLVDWKEGVGDYDVSLPALKVVECVNEQLLLEILLYSKVEVVYIDRKHLTSKLTLSLGPALQKCQDLKELHFKGLDEIGGSFAQDSQAKRSRRIIPLLSYIPASLQRLSFAQNSSTIGPVEKYDLPELFAAIQHLKNLERVLLPADCSLGALAGQIDFPKLEWIFALDGSYVIGPRSSIVKSSSVDPGDNGKIAEVLWYGNPEVFAATDDKYPGGYEIAIKVKFGPTHEREREDGQKSSKRLRGDESWTKVVHLRLPFLDE